MINNSMVTASIASLLHFSRQQFGYSLTLKSGGSDEHTPVALLSVQSPYPGQTASIVLRTGKDTRVLSLVKALSLFNLTPCSIDDSKTHLQMCEYSVKHEMQIIQKTHAVDKARAEWHTREFERYQARRVAMGLRPLQHASQRSHWDEEMRLAYIEKYDGNAYQKQRAKDIEEQHRDFKQIDEDAWADVTVRLDENIDLYPELESVTITNINVKTPGQPCIFYHCFNTILEFYLNACKCSTVTIADASSGTVWLLDGGMFSRVAPSSVCHRPTLNYLPRGPGRTAAQCFSDPRHAAGHPALVKLHELALNDIEIEQATLRFYSGSTFVQYVFEGPSDLATDSDAIALACNSDIDGESVTAINGRRPVFFVLAQIILNLTLERARCVDAGARAASASASATDMQHTLHIYDFFDCMWRDYVLKSAAFIDSRTYLFQNMTVSMFTEVFKTLLIELFGDAEMFQFHNRHNHKHPFETA